MNQPWYIVLHAKQYKHDLQYSRYYDVRYCDISGYHDISVYYDAWHISQPQGIIMELQRLLR